MRLLRKVKVGVRLFFMFGFLAIAFVGVGISGSISRIRQTEDMEGLNDDYVDHLATLADVNITTGNLFLSYRNYYLEYPDQEKMQVRLTDINERTNFILTKLQDYQKVVTARQAPANEIANVNNAIKKMQDEVIPFNEKLIALVQSEQMEEVHSLIISKELRSLRSTLQDELITEIYNDCVANISGTLDENITTMKAENIRISGSVTFGAVLVLTLAFFTVRSIVVPVNRLVTASKEIAAGRINVNLPELGNDEIGELTKQFGRVAEVLTTLTEAMGEMAEQHKQGDIDALVDETVFEGAFRDVAAGVNHMTASYVQHLRDLNKVLTEIGAGNFDAEYALLPGKKARLNGMVDRLRGNLKDIDREIKTLSNAAVEGKLSERTRPENFKGDWQRLLVGLNSVMDAIINPINEASQVLMSMSKGDLSAKVQGRYKGDFTLIADSINSTQEAISSYITEISSVLGEMSSQNLKVSIDRPYIGDFSRIKDSINMILRTFNNTLQEFNESAAQVAIGSKQIADISSDLAKGATIQASTVEELDASVEQIVQQTVKSSDFAQKANGLAGKVKEGAVKEAEMMQETLTAMEAINEASANISKIIKVIDDIAFQTNLLALNAAVEAARAGEHGVGFAVVAEEVRNLAARSQAAARDTTALIESSTQKASEGARVATETAKGLEEVVEQITDISGYIGIIAEASQEQRINIDQIRQGISQVARVTQDSTAISQESAASSEELSSQAEMFRHTINGFKLK